jgi:hypothetical protein
MHEISSIGGESLVAKDAQKNNTEPQSCALAAGYYSVLKEAAGRFDLTESRYGNS